MCRRNAPSIARERGARLIDAHEGVEAARVAPPSDIQRIRLRTPSNDYGIVDVALRGTQTGAVRPAGVDSKTKTDQDRSHWKDLDRVRRFHEAAKATAARERAAGRPAPLALQQAIEQTAPDDVMPSEARAAEAKMSRWLDKFSAPFALPAIRSIRIRFATTTSRA